MEGAKDAQKAQKAIYECLVQFHFKNLIQVTVVRNEVADNFNTRQMTFFNWDQVKFKVRAGGSTGLVTLRSCSQHHQLFEDNLINDYLWLALGHR